MQRKSRATPKTDHNILFNLAFLDQNRASLQMGRLAKLAVWRRILPGAQRNPSDGPKIARPQTS
jgi:hypothetical protein